MDVENMHHGIAFRMPSSAKKGLSISNKNIRSGIAPTPVKIFSESSTSKDGLKTPGARPRKALGDLSNRRAFGDRTNMKTGGAGPAHAETLSSRKQQPRRTRRAKMDIEICPVKPPLAPEYEDDDFSEQLGKHFEKLMNPSAYTTSLGRTISTPPSIAKAQKLIDDITIIPAAGAIWNDTDASLDIFGDDEIEELDIDFDNELDL